jgi:hypothetical protein
MDRGDSDFASTNPMYVPVPGATPAAFVVAFSKDGHMYLLDSKNLGGMGGQKVDFTVAQSGMSIHTAPTAYRTAMGVHVALSTDAGAACPSGGGGGPMVLSVLIPPGAPPAPRVLWCAPLAGVTAPIATTTDGTNNAIVWFISNGHLTGVDGDTGAAVYTGTDSCAGVRQWTSPIAVKGRIVTGADGHLCSWSPAPAK